MYNLIYQQIYIVCYLTGIIRPRCNDFTLNYLQLPPANVLRVRAMKQRFHHKPDSILRNPGEHGPFLHGHWIPSVSQTSCYNICKPRKCEATYGAGGSYSEWSPGRIYHTYKALRLRALSACDYGVNWHAWTVVYTGCTPISFAQNEHSDEFLSYIAD